MTEERQCKAEAIKQARKVPRCVLVETVVSEIFKFCKLPTPKEEYAEVSTDNGRKLKNSKTNQGHL